MVRQPDLRQHAAAISEQNHLNGDVSPENYGHGSTMNNSTNQARKKPQMHTFIASDAVARHGGKLSKGVHPK